MSEAVVENPLPLFSCRQLTGLSPRNHQPRPYDYQNDADGRRDFFVMFGGDTDMSVAKVDAVMFRVRDGNEKGENPQHHQENSHQ
jgi:hypothetical protein